ncbi:MAG: enoyl-CoA hydratase/isomerase family protein, partial [Candidatus Hydrogenedentes bacterium]|nr:enoyl-CoA hydratase/isomerase family protein [Candidatus Hydrogenedentota bacterium]
MEQAGIVLPPIAQALRDIGVDSFYKTENGIRKYFDLATRSYQPAPSNPNELRLVNLRTRKSNVLKQNDGAELIDLGDGILCAAFHTKMNAIDADIMQALNEAVDLLDEGKFDGLVVANQEEHFCAGANIFVLLGEIMQGNWDRVELAVSTLQKVNMRMKYCDKPVVAAPHHYTLGGGVEVAQHADICVIAGETYGGLVEVGVGLLPAGGGVKEMLVRALEYVPEGVQVDPFPFIRRAFENIAMAKVSTSGAEFIELGYLRPSDILLPNFDHQVAKAKAVCRGMVVSGYRPPLPPRPVALGEPVRAAFRAAVWGLQQSGFASEHDGLIATKIAHVLTGGDRFPGSPVTEQDLLDLEREAFCSLCGTEKTQQRIQNMLATGKPLRN